MKGIQYEASVDTSKFSRGMAQARGEIASLKRAGGSGNLLPGADSASNSISGLSTRAANLSPMLRGITAASSGMGAGLAGAGAMAAGAAIPVAAFAGALGLARAQLAAVAEMDSLTRALKNIEGSSSATGARLERLRSIAKAPGLGLEEVIKADVRLRSAGLSANLSAQSIKTFGNAITAAGGSKADLDGVVVALGQIASKGAISAEEINQIAERVPQIRVAMQQAFNTADTTKIQQMGMSAETFINGITASLAKIPQATGGVQNTLDNFSDAWKELKYEALDSLTPISSSVVSFTTDVMEGYTSVMKLSKGFMGLKSAALSGPDNTDSKFADLKAQREQLASDRAELEARGVNAPGEMTTKDETAKRLEALRQEDDLKAANAQFEQKLDQERAAAIEKQKKLEIEAAKEAQSRIAAAREEAYELQLSQEENLQRKISNLNKAGGNTEAEYKAQQSVEAKAKIAEKIVETIRLEKQLKELQDAKKVKTPPPPPPPPEDLALAQSQMQAARDFKLEMDILAAKNSGQEDYAKTLERQYAIEKLKLSIMQQQGVSAKQALALATQKMNLQDQADAPKEKKRGVAGQEQSARNRYNRMSDGDKAKAGSFDQWIEKNPMDRRAIAAERAEKAKLAGGANGSGLGGTPRKKRAEGAALTEGAVKIGMEAKASDKDTTKNEATDLPTMVGKILETLEKFGTASA